jgi:hypothetical protein
MTYVCSDLRTLPPVWTDGPLWNDTDTAFSYIAKLKDKLRRDPLHLQRTPFEKAAEMLQRAVEHPRYATLATTYLSSLLSTGTELKETALKEFEIHSLMGALESHKTSVRPPTATATINRFNTPRTPPRNKPFQFRNPVQCECCGTSDS